MKLVKKIRLNHYTENFGNVDCWEKFDDDGNYISTEKYYKGEIVYYKNSNGDFWYNNIMHINNNENKEIIKRRIRK